MYRDMHAGIWIAASVELMLGQASICICHVKKLCTQKGRLCISIQLESGIYPSNPANQIDRDMGGGAALPFREKAIHYRAP